ncbi:hypothetical protein ES705_47378 [subsurface metagenome]
MYEYHFYKEAWEELDRLIEAALKQRKEENMKTNTNTSVYEQDTKLNLKY